MVMYGSTVLLGQDPAFPCPSPGVPELCLPQTAGPHTEPTTNPSEVVDSPSCFHNLSDAGKVICSPHNPIDLLLPAWSPGTAWDAPFAWSTG